MALVVDVRLALVLLGRIGMRLVLVGERGVGMGVGRQFVFEVASVPQVVGDVHVLVVVDDRAVVMGIHAKLLPPGYRRRRAGNKVSDHRIGQETWKAPRAAPWSS